MRSYSYSKLTSFLTMLAKLPEFPLLFFYQGYDCFRKFGKTNTMHTHGNIIYNCPPEIRATIFDFVIPGARQAFQVCLFLRENNCPNNTVSHPKMLHFVCFLRIIV